MSKHKCWCFTSFVEPGLILVADAFRYAIWQKEKCPTTDSIHYQGYVEFHVQLRLSEVKKVLPSAHWEPRKGTQEQAIEYCKKSETRVEGPVEYGHRACPGRNQASRDLERAKEHIKTGGTIDELAETSFGVWVKHRRSLIDYHGVCMRAKAQSTLRLDIKVTVHWGRTGTGKTRGIYELGKPIYKLDSANNVWWDGYMGEKLLLIDDFYGWIKFGALLNVLDVYPLRLEVKGGFTYADWDEVHITSNRPPEEWYKELNHEQSAALKRRIHDIKIYD